MAIVQSGCHELTVTDVQYVIDNDEIPIVSQYKYLGCVIDEHLELNDMVEEKAIACKKALGA